MSYKAQFFVNTDFNITHERKKPMKTRIDKIEETDDKLTGRGGLVFFVRYLNNIGIFSLLTGYFGDLRKSKKGLPVGDLFKQIFCWFFDGTSRHLTWFDELAKDSGYAGTIEQPPDKMASSHAIKRFLKSFCIFKIWIFRKILKKLFIWRLRIQNPSVIFLDIDTMVMDNDDADKRQGVGPTYKNTAGFQPLQITWGRFVIDAIFRGGIRHSNHGDTVVKTVTQLVSLIRKEYCEDAVIVLTGDCGFFDQKNFAEFEKLGIFYIFGARITDAVRKVVTSLTKDNFGELKKEKQTWRFAESGFIYGTWDIFRRFIFCQPEYKDGQMLLPFDRAETLIVTNIRYDTVTDDMPEEMIRLTDTAEIVALYHSRGAAELVFRSLKDFGFEEMPFKRFVPNAALYYMMLIAFFLFEAFKADVLAPVIPLESYAGTVRRKFVDIAAKIVCHAGQITLKFTSAVFRRLRLNKIWAACHSAPPLY
jgi:hypothetical protein